MIYVHLFISYISTALKIIVWIFFSTGLHLSEDPISGMLNTESPAMESNGDGFLPDLPVLGQTADWSLDQVAPESLTNILPEDSDASQDASGDHHPDQQINSTELGSVEKAVEHFQIASAQLFQEEQPPLPPQPPEEGLQPSEHTVESAEGQQGSQEMAIDTDAAQESTQGKLSNWC